MWLPRLPQVCGGEGWTIQEEDLLFAHQLAHPGCRLRNPGFISC